MSFTRLCSLLFTKIPNLENCLWHASWIVLVRVVWNGIIDNIFTSKIIMNILEFNLHKMKYIMHNVDTVSCVFHFPDMWTIVTNVFAYSHHNQWLCGISCSNALEIPLCHYNMIPSYTPRTTKLLGGILVSLRPSVRPLRSNSPKTSVCPSVRLSVRPSVRPACRVRSVSSTVMDGFFSY